jgi:hypothetical protein
VRISKALIGIVSLLVLVGCGPAPWVSPLDSLSYTGTLTARCISGVSGDVWVVVKNGILWAVSEVPTTTEALHMLARYPYPVWVSPEGLKRLDLRVARRLTASIARCAEAQKILHRGQSESR